MAASSQILTVPTNSGCLLWMMKVIREKWSNKYICMWDRFSLFLPNLTFGEVTELNGFVWFVAISVFMQSISCGCFANVWTPEQFNSKISPAKVMVMISTDDGTFVLSRYTLGSKLQLMLESIKVMFQIGFSGCVSCMQFEGSDLVLFSSFFLQRKLDWWFQSMLLCRIFCSAFLRITLETDVEVHECSA